MRTTIRGENTVTWRRKTCVCLPPAINDCYRETKFEAQHMKLFDRDLTLVDVALSYVLELVLFGHTFVLDSGLEFTAGGNAKGL